jgi:hypothetical protein
VLDSVSVASRPPGTTDGDLRRAFEAFDARRTGLGRSSVRDAC